MILKRARIYMNYGQKEDYGILICAVLFDNL